MAFDDLPIVDTYSINEERSNIKLLELLNQTNNFICRKDVPDKGCDFDVELIGNGALNWRFPVQLKSVETLKLINDNEFISYRFETSRLGYLLRRPISGGLIILYSLEKDKCFYEYADKVYTRLTEER